MVSVKKMYEAEKKRINIYFKGGDIWKNKYINLVMQPEDEGEEYALDFENYLINQSEIEKIEILD